ncbi:MAG TPA: HEPN domain-containing protein [Candidatus Brocadiia bacterium]|nr:HEPN domain-containing protein [Candidatus Brocadiia bacterium]
MDKRVEQWFMQAEYDLDTAECMLQGGRCFYAVFMAHLAIEKALKGVWQAKLRDAPPKTHSLVYLVEKLGLTPPAEVDEFLVTLNSASVATRYPDDLQKMIASYSEAGTRRLLDNSREALAWIKTQQ